MIGTFIKRPVFTTMFILLLVVFGIRCYPEIGVDLNPDVDLPIVSVRVTYSGASPQEMETLVTKPIENRVSQVSGINTQDATVYPQQIGQACSFNPELAELKTLQTGTAQEAERLAIALIHLHRSLKRIRLRG